MAVAALLVAAGIPLVLTLLSALARRPGNLGVRNGRLAPCPASPNCVCSQDDDPAHHVEPIPFTGSPHVALAFLVTAVTAQPRTRLLTVGGNYLHAEFGSRVFRFVDDVEFLIDADQGVIHVRSASRAGYSDFGVNRRRIETLRAALGGLEAPPDTETLPDVRTEPLTEADQRDIRRVIALQLAAFRCDDSVTAFSFASPRVQSVFQTPGVFMQMVVRGYAAVHRPKSVEFGELDSVPREPIQTVLLIGPDDAPARAEYTMEKQSDGSWRINACFLTR
jgi:uncharacterized protein (DUF1499 family)